MHRERALLQFCVSCDQIICEARVRLRLVLGGEVVGEQRGEERVESRYLQPLKILEVPSIILGVLLLILSPPRQLLFQPCQLLFCRRQLRGLASRDGGDPCSIEISRRVVVGAAVHSDQLGIVGDVVACDFFNFADFFFPFFVLSRKLQVN
jgi:hypothetical protein